MQTHTFKSGFTTQFEYIRGTRPTTVLYIHGLCSDPWGTKPNNIARFATDNGFSFLRFELAGHGSDIARSSEMDFNVWKNQVFEIIDDIIAPGDSIVVVGSSLGGWLSLIAARDRANRITGVLGLAPAPDFTYDMENFVLTDAEKAELATGILRYPTKEFEYVVTKHMFDTARENLLLQSPLEINCPVHIIHGTDDKNVDPKKPFKLQSVLTSPDVVVKLIKGAGHRLQRDIDTVEIMHSLAVLTAGAK